jgi:hypothetical protein
MRHHRPAFLVAVSSPTTTTLRVLAAVPLIITLAACGSAPGESTATTAAAISGPTIVSNAMQWVNADLHYCQAAYGAVDDDSSCWAFEGPSHACDRQNNPAWNAYRSDCSGFVTWAWGLPPVGDGGYVTSDFAPFSTAISFTINGADLQPGDALNLASDEHIVLFKQWVTPGQSAIFMEEPGCSSATPYAHEFTSDVSISGDEVYIDYEGAKFYAIRYNGSAGGGGGGGGTASCSLAGQSYPTNTCTETLQCDNGAWISRTSDAASCDSSVLPNGACLSDTGSVDSMNTCTSMRRRRVGRPNGRPRRVRVRVVHTELPGLEHDHRRELRGGELRRLRVAVRGRQPRRAVRLRRMPGAGERDALPAERGARHVRQRRPHPGELRRLRVAVRGRQPRRAVRLRRMPGAGERDALPAERRARHVRQRRPHPAGLRLGAVLRGQRRRRRLLGCDVRAELQRLQFNPEHHLPEVRRRPGRLRRELQRAVPGRRHLRRVRPLLAIMR